LRRRSIVDFASQNRLPLISEIRVRPPGAVTYQASLDLPTVRHYVDKSSRAPGPPISPSSNPSGFELVINTPDSQGPRFDVPQSILVRADRHQ
jgi:hypothetical protein